MAATATGTERAVKTGIGGGPRPRNGNGFHKNGGGDDTPFQFSPARYRASGGKTDSGVLPSAIVW